MHLKRQTTRNRLQLDNLDHVNTSKMDEAASECKPYRMPSAQTIATYGFPESIGFKQFPLTDTASTSIVPCTLISGTNALQKSSKDASVHKELIETATSTDAKGGKL